MSKNPKQEPWFKPRPDEDADDAMLDAKFGRGNGGGGGRDHYGHNRSCVTVIAIGAALGLILVLLGIGGVKAVAAPAQSQVVTAVPAGWQTWLMPTGTICVQTGGSTYWPFAQVVGAINATDVSMVAKASCRGYARNMTVTFQAFYDTSSGAPCASMYSTGWTWQNIRGVWAWAPKAPYIKVNFASTRAGCRSTHRKRLNLMSHELLHVVGLSHATGVTVMLPSVNERYVAPTVYDVARINRRY